MNQQEWQTYQLGLMAAELRRALERSVDLLFPHGEEPRVYVLVGAGGYRFMLMLIQDRGSWFWTWGRGEDCRVPFGPDALRHVTRAVRSSLMTT